MYVSNLVSMTESHDQLYVKLALTWISDIVTGLTSLVCIDIATCKTHRIVPDTHAMYSQQNTHC